MMPSHRRAPEHRALYALPGVLALLGDCSLSEFEERTRVGPETLVGWANGDAPTRSTVQRIAACLRRDVADVAAAIETIRRGGSA